MAKQMAQKRREEARDGCPDNGWDVDGWRERAYALNDLLAS